MTFFIVFTALASGELSILQSPPSIEFKGSDSLESETLSDVFAASIGYSVENPSGWNGLYINNPFNTPKSLLIVYVDGVEKLNLDKSKNYRLIGSASGDSLNQLSSTVRQSNSVVDLDLTQDFDSVRKSLYSFIYLNLLILNLFHFSSSSLTSKFSVQLNQLNQKNQHPHLNQVYTLKTNSSFNSYPFLVLLVINWNRSHKNQHF